MDVGDPLSEEGLLGVSLNCCSAAAVRAGLYQYGAGAGGSGPIKVLLKSVRRKAMGSGVEVSPGVMKPPRR